MFKELTKEEIEFDKNSEIAEERLKPMLTNEFLETLRIAVKTCGWDVDHIESSAFVDWCFEIAGKDKPDTEAIDYEKGSE